MATIRDVAKHANVSIATVSRVLAEDESYKVTDLTRERVFSAANELGYVLKGRARKTKVHNIGCILAMTAEKYSDPYFVRVLSALENRLMEHNCMITMIRNYNEIKNPQRLELAFNQELAGLIIMDALPTDVFSYIKQRVTHIVGCDTAYEELDNVSFDMFHATCKAVSHLVERGYKKIAYVGGVDPSRLGGDRRIHALKAMSESLNLPVNPDFICDSEWDVEKSLQMVRSLLSRPKASRPDAIIAGNDTLASAILTLVQELGISVPSDVAVMGFNNDPHSAYTFPSLTTIHLPVQEIGRTAADLLYSRISGDTSIKRDIIFPTKIILRMST